MRERRIRPLARSRLAALLAATCVAALGACKETLPPPIIVTDGIAGRYVLQTVNGFPPPQIILERNDSTLSIKRGVVILNADSTFTDSTEIQWIISGSATDTVDVAKGFFRTSNTPGMYNFFAGSAAYTMTRDDNALVQNLQDAGIILVYRK